MIDAALPFMFENVWYQCALSHDFVSFKLEKKTSPWLWNMTLHSTWYTNSYLKGQTIDNIVVIIYVNIYKHTEKSFEHVSSTVNTFPQLDNYLGSNWFTRMENPLQSLRNCYKVSLQKNVNPIWRGAWEQCHKFLLIVMLPAITLPWNEYMVLNVKR